MRKNLGRMVAVPLLFGGLAAHAQFSISPLTSFGGGDGWLRPGEGGYTYLTTGNTERGLAYANGHLYLASRAASGTAVRILNPQTGAEVGALDTTGITGGTFGLNMLAAGGDGVVYAANLTVQATTSPFKVYRWATESSAPVLAYTPWAPTKAFTLSSSPSLNQPSLHSAPWDLSLSRSGASGAREE